MYCRIIRNIILCHILYVYVYGRALQTTSCLNIISSAAIGYFFADRVDIVLSKPIEVNSTGPDGLPGDFLLHDNFFFKFLNLGDRSLDERTYWGRLSLITLILKKKYKKWNASFVKNKRFISLVLYTDEPFESLALRRFQHQVNCIFKEQQHGFWLSRLFYHT